MSLMGYDFIIEDANCGLQHRCRVCKTKCLVKRNVYGPTGYLTAISKNYSYHDEFKCPHSSKAWHEEAVELAEAIDETPSKRVAAIMKAELKALVTKKLRAKVR